MKRVGKEPRLLPNVMEAIASLKERQGSTQKQIIEHVAHILRKNKDGSRNVTMQIRRALEHGLHSGLIKHRSGKYTLGLDKRDYAIFRRFRQIDGPLADCTSCRRGRRRGRRGRRGRRRRSRRRRRHGRRRPASGDEASEHTDSERSITGTPEPMDRRSRRRRRRGRRGRRRGRRGRRRAAQNEEHSDSSETHHKDSNSAVPAEKRRSEQEKIDYQSKTASNHSHHQDRNHQDRNHSERNQDPEEDDIECGNPECLCNIKQEDDSPRCMSSDNYYNDSYLN